MAKTYDIVNIIGDNQFTYQLYNNLSTSIEGTSSVSSTLVASGGLSLTLISSGTYKSTATNNQFWVLGTEIFMYGGTSPGYPIVHKGTVASPPTGGSSVQMDNLTNPAQPNPGISSIYSSGSSVVGVVGAQQRSVLANGEDFTVGTQYSSGEIYKITSTRPNVGFGGSSFYGWGTTVGTGETVFASSADGLAWTNTAATGLPAFSGSPCVAVAADGTYALVINPSNGDVYKTTNFSSFSLSSDINASITSAASLGNRIVVNKASGAGLVTTTDGITWEPVTNALSVTQLSNGNLLKVGAAMYFLTFDSLWQVTGL